ncbi:MAG: hypothetical protein ED555_00005, partial [Allomuricauda sp.]
MAFSQTTVTLQDQCNCEVLSGTDVSAPGATTPAGVDAGDIYVNTTTGTIFYWDGDSWELTAVDTDDQQLQNFSFDTGTNILSLDIEDGNTVTVDLSNLSNTGTDDQQLSLVGNILTLEDGGTVDLTTFLDNTDDQQITDFSLTANILTLTLEDGGTQTVDLSGYVSTDDQTAAEVTYDNSTSGLTATDVQAAIDEVAAGSTDDQTVSTDGTAGNLSIEDGNSITLNVDDADADPTNEYNTGIGFDGANLTITDGGGNQTIDISGVSTDDQTVSTDGTAGNLSIEDGNSITLNVDDADADPTNEYNTGIGFDGANLTITDGGGNQTIDISGVSTDDQTAAEVTYDNSTSGLTATDVQAAIDEVAAGSTDDQTVSTDGTAGNLSIEDGNSITLNVDDADADPTNEYNTGIGFDGANLTITDGGGNQTIDISGVSTDDQTAAEVSYDNSTSGLTATDVQAAIDEVAAGSTDDQTVSTDGTAGNLSIEDGNSITLNVDDADADPTNEYNTGIGFDGANLTITDGGGNQTIDISGVSTDDQTAAEVSVADAGGNFTATDVEGALAELAAGSTDDQTLSTDGTAGNISIEDGNTLALNVNDADADPTNEYNTGSGITAGSLEITDGGGTESVNLISADANNDIVAGTDGALYLNVASVSIAETNTTLSFDGGTNTLTYTNELGNNPAIDLSSLDDSGTDDQTAAEVSYDNSTSGLTATDVQAAIDEVASGSTDDQTLSTDGTAGNISIEDGNTLALNVNDADADPTNEYNTGIGFDGANLTITDGGGNQTIDISGVSTDDQTAAEVSVADAGGNFTATDVEGALAELAAGSTDDQNISGSGLSGTDLTIGIENGTNEVVDLSSLVGTDDQTAAEVSYDNSTSGLTATDVQAALDEVAAGSTDDQQLDDTNTTFNAGTNTLTIALEDGGTATADLSALDDAGTDDQTLSTDGTAGNISIEDGNTLALNVNDADADATNEYITGSGITAGSLEITDGGGTESVNLISADANNDLAAGTDGALYLNVASVSIAETNTTLSFDGGTNTLTYTNELGNNPAIDLSSLDDSGTDDQTAAEVSYDNSTSGLTATDVQAAIDEVASGSTDDQTLSTDGTAGNISIEDGNTLALNVNDADADPTNEYNTGIGFDGANLTITDGGGNQTIDISGVSTDDQTAAEVSVADAGGNFTATDVEGALAELAAGSTDDQNISGSGLSGTDLTIGIENGTNEVVDLSSLVGTDDQTAAEVSVADAGGNFTATDVEGALAELAAGSTDDQNISGSGLSGTDLTIGIENGTNEVVDLSSLVGTDDQTAAEVSVADAGGNFTATDVEGALAELAAGSTDDQNISGSGLSGTDLTIGIENGTNEVVDLSSLVGTDDQNIESLGVDTGTNILTVGIENGTSQTVDLSHLDDAGTDDQTAAEVSVADAGGNFTATDVEGALAELAAGSTDDQNISGSGLSGTDLTIGIENGTNEVVDLSSLVGTDDQNIESLGVDTGTNILTVGIENGTSQTVDLSHLDDAGTDDQTAAEVSVADAGGNFTATDVEGALAELAAGSTDDQNISGSGLSGTDLTIGIENGTNEVVDLSSLVGTDDQNIESLGVDTGTNILTVGIENGTSQTVDLSHLDDAGTDDQNISGSGLSGTDLTIGIENGTNEVVDLSSLVGTDDQNIESLGVDTGTNILTVGIENGTSQTVDLSHLDDAGTDDQTAAEVTVADVGGNFTNNEVEGVLEEIDARIDALVLAGGSDGNDFVTGGSLSGTDLTLNVPNQIDPVIDLSGLQDGTGTDDQNISGSGLSGTDLTIGIENGTNEVVDLSSLVGTDDQTAAEVSVADAGGNFTATDVEGALAELAAGSTDDQNISGSGLSGTDLTIGIENGTNEVVDLSSLVGTDDQNIESLGVDTGTNILTVGIENGTSQTVDLSHLDDAGTDDQNISGSGLSGTDLTIGIENGTNEVVDLSSLVGTDDQNISGSGLSGTDLTIGIENGTNEVVDLSSLVGTDDQN